MSYYLGYLQTNRNNILPSVYKSYISVVTQGHTKSLPHDSTMTAQSVTFWT